jgi:hypothetical protein
MGQALLSKIKDNFLVLSRGGTSEGGYKWKPLKPQTIAQRRVTGAEKKSLGISGRRVRGLLTLEQDRRWRGIFASTLAKLRAMGIPEGMAMATAARIAWGILKSQGAETRLSVFGHRQVDIGRDSGLLLRSLTPGTEDRLRPANGDQILEAPPGAVIVGSKVPYAAKFHATRPLWPEELPDSWWKAILDAMTRGIAVAAETIVRRR